VLLPEGVDRQAVSAMLDRAGVRTGIHFPPLHTFTWFKEHAELGPGGTPVADAMAPRVLSLPLHAQITRAQIDQVCDALATALG
jgi:dTDP-4-amino-4,6-dideoxygalactose transaminase